MDEIVQLICNKTGISADQAQGAVTTVVGFLKDKLPGGIGDQVESFINGGGSGVGDIASNLSAGLGDKIGGMFGG